MSEQRQLAMSAICASASSDSEKRQQAASIGDVTDWSVIEQRQRVIVSEQHQPPTSMT
jgi:hypothetical protein